MRRNCHTTSFGHSSHCRYATDVMPSMREIERERERGGRVREREKGGEIVRGKERERAGPFVVGPTVTIENVSSTIVAEVGGSTAMAYDDSSML